MRKCSLNLYSKYNSNGMYYISDIYEIISGVCTEWYQMHLRKMYTKFSNMFLMTFMVIILSQVKMQSHCYIIRRQFGVWPFQCYVSSLLLLQYNDLLLRYFAGITYVHVILTCALWLFHTDLNQAWSAKVTKIKTLLLSLYNNTGVKKVIESLRCIVPHSS